MYMGDVHGRARLRQTHQGDEQEQALQDLADPPFFSPGRPPASADAVVNRADPVGGVSDSGGRAQVGVDSSYSGYNSYSFGSLGPNLDRATVSTVLVGRHSNGIGNADTSQPYPSSDSDQDRDPVLFSSSPTGSFPFETDRGGRGMDRSTPPNYLTNGTNGYPSAVGAGPGNPGVPVLAQLQLGSTTHDLHSESFLSSPSNHTDGMSDHNDANDTPNVVHRADMTNGHRNAQTNGVYQNNMTNGFRPTGEMTNGTHPVGMTNGIHALPGHHGGGAYAHQDRLASVRSSYDGDISVMDLQFPQPRGNTNRPARPQTGMQEYFDLTESEFGIMPTRRENMTEEFGEDGSVADNLGSGFHSGYFVGPIYDSDPGVGPGSTLSSGETPGSISAVGAGGAGPGPFQATSVEDSNGYAQSDFHPPADVSATSGRQSSASRGRSRNRGRTSARMSGQTDDPNLSESQVRSNHGSIIIAEALPPDDWTPVERSRLVTGLNGLVPVTRRLPNRRFTPDNFIPEIPLPAPQVPITEPIFPTRPPPGPPLGPPPPLPAGVRIPGVNVPLGVNVERWIAFQQPPRCARTGRLLTEDEPAPEPVRPPLPIPQVSPDHTHFDWSYIPGHYRHMVPALENGGSGQSGQLATGSRLNRPPMPIIGPADENDPSVTRIGYSVLNVFGNSLAPSDPSFISQRTAEVRELGGGGRQVSIFGRDGDRVNPSAIFTTNNWPPREGEFDGLTDWPRAGVEAEGLPPSPVPVSEDDSAEVEEQASDSEPARVEGQSGDNSQIPNRGSSGWRPSSPLQPAFPANRNRGQFSAAGLFGHLPPAPLFPPNRNRASFSTVGLLNTIPPPPLPTSAGRTHFTANPRVANLPPPPPPSIFPATGRAGIFNQPIGPNDLRVLGSAGFANERVPARAPAGNSLLDYISTLPSADLDGILQSLGHNPDLLDGSHTGNGAANLNGVIGPLGNRSPSMARPETDNVILPDQEMTDDQGPVLPPHRNRMADPIGFHTHDSQQAVLQQASMLVDIADRPEFDLDNAVVVDGEVDDLSPDQLIRRVRNQRFASDNVSEQDSPHAGFRLSDSQRLESGIRDTVENSIADELRDNVEGRHQGWLHDPVESRHPGWVRPFGDGGYSDRVHAPVQFGLSAETAVAVEHPASAGPGASSLTQHRPPPDYHHPVENFYADEGAIGGEISGAAENLLGFGHAPPAGPSVESSQSARDSDPAAENYQAGSSSTETGQGSQNGISSTESSPTDQAVWIFTDSTVGRPRAPTTPEPPSLPAAMTDFLVHRAALPSESPMEGLGLSSPRSVLGSRVGVNSGSAGQGGQASGRVNTFFKWPASYHVNPLDLMINPMLLMVEPKLSPADRERLMASCSRTFAGSPTATTEELPENATSTDLAVDAQDVSVLDQPDLMTEIAAFAPHQDDEMTDQCDLTSDDDDIMMIEQASVVAERDDLSAEQADAVVDHSSSTCGRNEPISLGTEQNQPICLDCDQGELICLDSDTDESDIELVEPPVELAPAPIPPTVPSIQQAPVSVEPQQQQQVPPEMQYHHHFIRGTCPPPEPQQQSSGPVYQHPANPTQVASQPHHQFSPPGYQQVQPVQQMVYPAYSMDGTVHYQAAPAHGWAPAPAYPHHIAPVLMNPGVAGYMHPNGQVFVYPAGYVQPQPVNQGYVYPVHPVGVHSVVPVPVYTGEYRHVNPVGLGQVYPSEPVADYSVSAVPVPSSGPDQGEPSQSDPDGPVLDYQDGHPSEQQAETVFVEQDSFSELAHDQPDCLLPASPVQAYLPSPTVDHSDVAQMHPSPPSPVVEPSPDCSPLSVQAEPLLVVPPPTSPLETDQQLDSPPEHSLDSRLEFEGHQFADPSEQLLGSPTDALPVPPITSDSWMKIEIELTYTAPIRRAGQSKSRRRRASVSENQSASDEADKQSDDKQSDSADEADGSVAERPKARGRIYKSRTLADMGEKFTGLPSPLENPFRPSFWSFERAAPHTCPDKVYFAPYAGVPKADPSDDGEVVEVRRTTSHFLHAKFQPKEWIPVDYQVER